MALTTYTELKAAVADWLHRTDMTSVIVDCVALAEEKFNQRLRTKFQETALASTAINASYQVAIPAGTLAVKQMWSTANPNVMLLAKSLQFVMNRQYAATTVTNYAGEGSYWRFDGTGTVAGVLYAVVPPLATNSTNWLLTNYPSLYLNATLAEANLYARDTEAMALFNGLVDLKITELNRNAHRDEFSGPLLVRAA
jgi:hypothetical protein